MWLPLLPRVGKAAGDDAVTACVSGMDGKRGGLDSPRHREVLARSQRMPVTARPARPDGFWLTVPAEERWGLWAMTLS